MLLDFGVNLACHLNGCGELLCFFFLSLLMWMRLIVVRMNLGSF